MESIIVDQHVVNYIRSLLPENGGLLRELEQYADEHHVPIIHPEIAQYLRVFLKLNKPKRMLEVGTAIGYSASVFAHGMESGRIDTIELSEKMHDKAVETFKTLNQLLPEVEVNLHFGDAKDVLPTLEGGYDLIFLDASKGHYMEFFESTFDLLNDGGIILSDNVLYKGMIASDVYLERRKKTIVKRMRTYLEYISNHPRLETTILPMGDGFAISYKKGAQNEED